MSDQHFLLRWGGREMGPFPLSAIDQKLDAHEIGLWHEIQTDGRWITLREFYEELEQQRGVQLAHARAVEQRAAERRYSQPLPDASDPATKQTVRRLADRALAAPLSADVRSRHFKVFAALGLFLGFTGLHNFYVGRWRTGLAQVALSALTTWYGYGIILTWIWALIEIVFVHRDRHGVQMA